MPADRFPVRTVALLAALAAAAIAVPDVRSAAVGALPGAGRAGAAATAAPATGPHPGMLAAVEQATRAAAEAGLTLTVASGYRTAQEQQALLDAEVAARGSLEEATRWVFPPERSMHVRGLAIDVGNGPAADWLLAEGARFGLCQTLDWEWWHFEWRQAWEDAGACPPPASDPAGAPPP